ncbi:MAG: aminopeptidase P family protein [Bacteroidales bacterium]|jgi:Xaa-Pro aminopeptidase|nr:aminopeptidase P family protein [Bacteroidales bacterium]
MFTKETYMARREQLKKSVGSGILVLPGNDECGMNYEDNTYDFRQDSTFLYFFGLPYAGLTAIIDIDRNEEIIFGDEATIDDIVWTGTQPSLRERCEKAGITKILPSKKTAGFMHISYAEDRKFHCLPPYRAEHRLKLLEWLGCVPEPSVEFIRAVVSQRNRKSADEIAEIEKACNITSDMHIAAMRELQIGMKECEIAGLMSDIACSAGGRPAFPIIATVNGQTLHNHYHGNTVKDGDMLLIDAGAETETGYCGDMSSTIPAGKKFTPAQKEIYDIQVASHLAAVEALRPGVPFEAVYNLSAKVICEGMKSLGLMRGDMEEAVEAGAHALFFPCGLGHMMGLDVHDMENLGEVWVGYDGKPKSTQFGRKSLRLARPLEPGFVLTVEPGIYFIPELIDLWESEKRFSGFINYEKVKNFRSFGGLRNEEDYLITETGARRLGKKIPLTTAEVEELR